MIALFNLKDMSKTFKHCVRSSLESIFAVQLYYPNDSKRGDYNFAFTKLATTIAQTYELPVETAKKQACIEIMRAADSETGQSCDLTSLVCRLNEKHTSLARINQNINGNIIWG